jgi:hypothetical protein
MQKQTGNTGARGTRGPGRPKGKPNRTTTALKEAILAAAQAHGEDDKGKGGLEGYLRKVAREDVKAFSGLLGKVLPLQIAGDGDNPLTIKVQIGGE